MAARAGRASWRERIASALQTVWVSRGAASTALLPAAWLFGAASALRRWAYGRGIFETNRLPVPVVVVGNLVAGGAGKTPTVIAVVELLRERGYVPGVVSRGYGRRVGAVFAIDHDASALRRADGGRSGAVVTVDDDASAADVGDEPLLIFRRTRAPVVVGNDRVAAGHALLQAEPSVDVVVSDDGLQHLALDRDAEIVVFDERGAGNGRLLPAGPLREPLPRRLGDRQRVLYNTDAPTTGLVGECARRSLAGAVALDRWWAGERPSRAVLDGLRDREIHAVAGIARPERFFAMLRESGLRFIAIAPGDHHDFVRPPWPPDARDVVVTEKDAVKLAPSRRLGLRVWVVGLDFALAPSFAADVLALLPPPRASVSAPPTVPDCNEPTDGHPSA